MRWTRKNIAAAIENLHSQGADLNYASAEAAHLNLVRAATWHFGTWQHAVEAAGISYEDVSKYRQWTRERIIERIRQLHAQGEDLSWREVSTRLDPSLAAAALRPNGFSSWREAIGAAGLDIERIARYQRWNADNICEEIARLHQNGAPLSSKLAQIQNQALFCAARRHFGSWDNALRAAGLDVENIRLRHNARAEIHPKIEAEFPMHSPASRRGRSVAKS